jgi:hypothetical protein
MKEISMLVLLHAGLGELGVLCFLWIIAEIINGSQDAFKRARIVSVAGLLLFVGSWIVGGYYYVTVYGPIVKPVVLGSPYPWAHGIVMEVKEHVFLLVPIMAAAVTIALLSSRDFKEMTKRGRTALGLLSGLVFLAGFSMAFLGFLIASGARAGLAAGGMTPVP